MKHLVLLSCLALGSAAAALSQTRVIGEVTAFEAGKQITVRDDAGKSTVVPLNEKTSYVRVAPGETNLSKAAAITGADVVAGDRVLATFPAAGAPAARVLVMSKSDIEQKRQAEAAEWQKRGHAGTITAIDPATRKVTVTSRSLGSSTSFTVEGTDKTQFRRYAPDSVRFADAKPSRFEDLKLGDQVRVLGDREAGNVRAEVLVSGSFRNIAGTVASVDPATGEIRLTDLSTKQPLTVRTGSDAMMRRLPPQAAEMMAKRLAATQESAGEGNQQRSRVGDPGEAAARRGGGGDMQQMLERLPPLAIADLKPGDAVIVASTAGTDPSKVTAIAVIAGVEPLLTAPRQAGDSRLGGQWNFDINIMP